MAKDTGASPEEGIGVLPLVDGKDGDEEVFVDDGAGGKGGGAQRGQRAADDGGDLDGDDDPDGGGEALDSDAVDTGAEDREFKLPAREADADREKDDAGKRDDADDLDDFPTKVRKRINREVRLKHEAEDRARAAEERAERAEREIAKANNERAVQDIDAQIAERKTKLKQARAELDTDAEADLITELSVLAARKAAAGSAGADGGDAAAKAKVSPEETRRVEAWYGRNDWMKDERMAWKKKIALEVNAELLGRGLKPSSDEFYKELDDGISERVRSRRRTMDRSPVDSGDRSAGGDQDGGDAGRREGRRPTRVVITDADKRDMRRYGLNPNDPAHLKSYAAEKAASGG